MNLGHQNIAFIGGIHGVGKSTVSKAICAQTGLMYISASDLIKWSEVQEKPADKRVSNIDFTQERLISAIQMKTDRSSRYLLDGHFCLLDSDSKINKVPIDIFKRINPFSLNIIVGNVDEIKDQLEKRDGVFYSLDFLAEMQGFEMEYAKELSCVLDVELNIGTSSDALIIIDAIKQKIQ